MTARRPPVLLAAVVPAFYALERHGAHCLGLERHTLRRPRRDPRGHERDIPLLRPAPDGAGGLPRGLQPPDLGLLRADPRPRARRRRVGAARRRLPRLLPPAHGALPPRRRRP